MQQRAFDAGFPSLVDARYPSPVLVDRTCMQSGMKATPSGLPPVSTQTSAISMTCLLTIPITIGESQL